MILWLNVLITKLISSFLIKFHPLSFYNHYQITFSYNHLPFVCKTLHHNLECLLLCREQDNYFQKRCKSSLVLFLQELKFILVFKIKLQLRKKKNVIYLFIFILFSISSWFKNIIYNYNILKSISMIIVFFSYLF